MDFPGVTRDAGVPLLEVLPGVTGFRIFGVAFVTLGVAVLEAGVAGLEVRGVADFFTWAGVGCLGVGCLGLCVTWIKIIQIAIKSNEKKCNLMLMWAHLSTSLKLTTIAIHRIDLASNEFWQVTVGPIWILVQSHPDRKWCIWTHIHTHRLAGTWAWKMNTSFMLPSPPQGSHLTRVKPI